MKKKSFIDSKLGILCLVFFMLIMVFHLGSAAPAVTWQTAFSSSTIGCPATAQGEGTSMVDVSGILYVILGNSTTTFFKYTPSSNQCTTLTAFPTTVNAPTAMEKIDNDTLYVLLSNQIYTYKITANTWIAFDRAKLSDGTPIDQTGATQGNGNVVAAAGNDFYVLAGGGTTFQRYTPSTNTWTSRTALPVSAGSGAALAYSGSGDFIYALAGNSTTNSYRYSISGNTWTALGATPAAVNAGGALTIVGTNLYAFGGNNSKNFWRYDTTQTPPGSWTNLTSTNTPPDFIRGGGALTSVGTTIYALQGNSSKNFWKYDTGTGLWNSGGAPDQTPGKVASGGALTADGTNVYAFMGRNNKTFWKYTVATDTWSVLQNIPLAAGPSTDVTTAKGGLTYSSSLNEIYAVTGNGVTGLTTSGRGILWRYSLSGAEWPYYAGAPAGPTSIGYGATITHPGIGSSDPTGDYLYLLRGLGSLSFWKYSPFNSTWIPWDRAKMGTNTAVSQTTPSTLTQSSGNFVVEADGEIYMSPGGSVTFFKYNPLTNIWTQLADMPTTGMSDSGTLVKKDDDTIYAVNLGLMAKYDIPTDTWHTNFPIGKDDNGVIYSQDGPSQSTGSTITEVSGKLFIARGGGSSEFWEFDPTTNTWVTLATTPLAFTDGTALTKAGTDIYALRGGGLNIYKFDTIANSWTSTLTSMPGATVIGAGGSIIYPGTGDFLYALKGNNTQEFYRYSISGNSWATLAVTPASVQAGGSLTMIGSDIYALSGNGTTNFWKYDTTQTPGSDSWTTLTSAPESVSSGGALTTDTRGTGSTADDIIYATKGGASKTFWKYTPDTATWHYDAFAPDNFGQASTLDSYGGIVYSETLGDIFAITGNGDNGLLSTNGNGQIFRYKLTSGADQNTWVHAPGLANTPASTALGVSMAYPGTGNFIYTLGGRSTNFWSYDIVQNEWNAFVKSTLSNGETISQAGATQHSSGAIIEVDNYFYIVPSVSTTTFFEKYDPATNTFYTLAPAPFTTGGSGRNVSMLQLPGEPDNIYVLVEGSGDNFFRYSIANNTWTTLTDTPDDPGSSVHLLYPGDGEWLYTFTGNISTLTSDLWRYSLSKELWINFDRGRFDGYVNGNINTDPTPISQDGGSQAGGNALVSVDSVTHGKKIFMFPGNSTTFQEFNIETNTWTNRAVLPTSATGGTALVWDGVDVIYASNGSNFYGYCLPTATSCTFNGGAASPNTWTTLTSAGTFSSGASLTYPPGGGEFLYATRGRNQGTTSFHRYCMATIAGATCANGQGRDTWVTIATLPFTTDSGSALSSTDSDTIYLLGGGFTTNFAVYSISGDTWTNLTSTNPVPAAVNGGGGLINDGTFLYATRGNNTDDFYRYQPSATSGSRWSSLTDTPINFGDTSPGVHAGGITYIASINEIWGAPGSGTTGTANSNPKGLLFRYKIATNTWPTYDAPAASGLNLFRTVGAANFGTDNDIYLLKGDQGDSFKKYTISPDRTSEFPDAGSWVSLADSPVTSNGPLLSAIGSNFYALRGFDRPDLMYFSSNIQNNASLVGALNPTTVIATWAAVTNGSFRITIDGTLRTVTGMNFSGVTSMTDVANIIQSALRSVTGSTETVQWCTDFNNGYFLFRSATAAPGGSITVLSSAGIGTDISGVVGSNFTDADQGNVKNPSTTGDWAYCGDSLIPPDGPINFGNTNSGADTGDSYYSPTRNEIWVLNETGTTGNTTIGEGLLFRYRVDADSGTAGEQGQWPIRSALPATPATHSTGASLTAVNNTTLYALRGVDETPNPDVGTNNFWRFDIPSNAWTDLSSSLPTPALVGPGGSLTHDGSGLLFATRGIGTNTFWKFDTSSQTWNSPSTPGAAPVNIGTSTLTTGKGGIVYSNGNVWLTSGNGSNGVTESNSGLLYRYDVTNDTWPLIDDPANPTATGGFSGGSDASAVGTNEIYFLQGNSSTTNPNFFRYTLSTDAWDQRTSMPNNLSPLDVQSGGSLATTDNNTVIYGTRGKGTTGFFKYVIADNAWYSNATQDFPVNFGTSSSGTTTDRGELAYSLIENKLFGIPGSNTTVYSLDLDYRAAIESVNGGSNPLKNVAFDVVVQASDASGNPVNVSQDTQVTLSVGSGSGALGGTLTGTILNGQSQTTISGVTYNVAESGVRIRATDTSISPTLIASDSDPFNVVEAPPVITAISPNSGPTAGGNSITISGTNFQSGVNVTFDGITAEGVTYVNDTTLTVAPPRHALGTITVIATNPDTQNDSDSYTYAAPAPTLVNPPDGPPSGGTNVTITGTNFSQSYYQKPVTLTNAGSTLIDYETLLTIDTATLITEGKMRNDCGDLRILNNDELTNIPYYLESGCNTATTRVWSKVPSIPNGSSTIYLAYGRSAMTSQSSIGNVFIFGDDFNDSSLNTTKWPTTSGNLEGNEVSGGFLTLENGEGIFAGTSSIPGDTIWETSTDPKTTSRVGGAIRASTSTTNGFVGDGILNIIDILWWSSGSIFAETGNASSGGDQAMGAYTAGFKPYKITYRPGVPSVLFDYNNGQLTATRTTTILGAGTLFPVMYSSSGTGAAAQWDYIYIRQYTASEPGFSVGSETIKTVQVNFHDAPATNEVFVSSTSLSATTPAHAVGQVDVVVFNTDGVSGTLVNGFTYQTPVSADNSTFTAFPASVIANGLATSTLTATLKDPSNNLITGNTVTAATTSGPGSPTITPVTCASGGSAGVSNSSGEVCFTVSSTTAGTNVFTATETTSNPDVVITQTTSVTFTPNTVSPTTSTFTASPISVLADGTTTSTLTATIKDENSNTMSGRIVSVAQTSGPGSPSITAVACSMGDTPGTTNATGQACFRVTSTTKGTSIFTATETTSDPDVIITQTASVEFVCVIGTDQQCVEVTLIPPVGGLSLTAPGNFSFPASTGSTTATDRFSKDDPAYVLNVNDLVAVEDLRGESGFSLQVTASAFTDGSPPDIPLQNFYVVTTPSNTGGSINNGIEYSSGYNGQLGIMAPANTAGNLQDSSTFLNDGSALGTGSSGVAVVLMDAGLTPPAGRTGIFKQNVNYYVSIPAFQPPGNYQVTLTFDVIDDTTP